MVRRRTNALRSSGTHLEVRPPTGEQSDEEGERVDTRLPHVVYRVSEREGEEPGDVNRSVTDERHGDVHRRPDVRVRAEVDGDGADEDDRQREAEDQGEAWVTDQRAAAAARRGELASDARPATVAERALFQLALDDRRGERKGEALDTPQHTAAADVRVAPARGARALQAAPRVEDDRRADDEDE